MARRRDDVEGPSAQVELAGMSRGQSAILKKAATSGGWSSRSTTVSGRSLNSTSPPGPVVAVAAAKVGDDQRDRGAMVTPSATRR